MTHKSPVLGGAYAIRVREGGLGEHVQIAYYTTDGDYWFSMLCGQPHSWNGLMEIHFDGPEVLEMNIIPGTEWMDKFLGWVATEYFKDNAGIDEY